MRLLTLALLLFTTGVSAQSIEIEVGAANASYQWTDAHYARLSARFGDNKWALGMAHVGEQDFNTCEPWSCPVYAYRQLFLDVTRYVNWNVGKYKYVPDCVGIEAGVGPAIAQHMTRITPAHLNFHLSLGLRCERVTLTIHHYSNAGTSPTGLNMGQDAVTIGWRF